MTTITGTDGADTLTGTAGPDIINGLGGNDIINGGDGLDTIDGGPGDDIINKGDYRSGLPEDNVSGGDGNDVIFDFAFQNDVTVDGGNGDDRLILGLFGTSTTPPHHFTVTGGAGNDTVVIGSGAGSSIDLESGNDRLVYFNYGGSTVTLGDGADEVQLGFYGRPSTDEGSASIYSFGLGRRLVLNDYQPGIDTIKFVPRAIDFQGPAGWDGSNPVASGYLQLVQRGADAVLLQHDFRTDGDESTDLITFRNTLVLSLGASDFGGWSPDGSPAAGITINGTAGNDDGPADLQWRAGGLQGGNGNDTINGLGGDDLIFGGAGNDTLDGGDGNDIINGGAGSDTIHGGAGDDIIDFGASDSGSDSEQLFGDGGNDKILVQPNAGASILADGGDGADGVFVNLTPSRDYSRTSVVVKGGAGDDQIVVSGQNQVGNLTMVNRAGMVDIMRGAGKDTLQINGIVVGTAAPIVVRDFDPTQDQLGFPGTGFFSNLPAGTDPFADGHARWVQDGADAVLMLDIDGGGNAYLPSLRLLNTSISVLPGGGTTPVVGNPATVTGTSGDDILGQPDGGTFGNTSYVGGKGNDRYNVDVLDKVIELPDGGTDTIALFGNRGQLVAAYTMPDNVENLEVLTFITAPPVISNRLDNKITGNELANVFFGGAGNDTMTGQGGDDTLDGGSGVDTAVYISTRAQSIITRNPNGSITIDTRANQIVFDSPQFAQRLVSYYEGVDTVTNVELF